MKRRVAHQTPVRLNLGKSGAIRHASEFTEEYGDFNQGDFGDPWNLWSESKMG
jgi:hypothetical protein